MLIYSFNMNKGVFHSDAKTKFCLEINAFNLNGRVINECKTGLGKLYFKTEGKMTICIAIGYGCLYLAGFSSRIDGFNNNNRLIKSRHHFIIQIVVSNDFQKCKPAEKHNDQRRAINRPFFAHSQNELTVNQNFL